MDDATGEEEEERENRRPWCAMAFLLFLVGCTILFNNRNKHINIILLDAMWDLTRIHEWSWGGMKLTNLYNFVSKATDAPRGSLDRYMTLVELVIYFVFIFVVYHVIIC